MPEGQSEPTKPWPKFPKLLMPRDFFPWVLVSGGMDERGGVPFLHLPGCKGCRRDCNPRGAAMARAVVAWRDGVGYGCPGPEPRRRPPMDGAN
jgi:hypothetical protein